MFSLTMTSVRPASRPLSRSLANVVNPPSKDTGIALFKAGPLTRRSRNTRKKPAEPKPEPIMFVRTNGKVPVRQDHGLYAFFRKRKNNLPGEAGYEVLETPEDAQIMTGRAWEAAELRNKSFRDLHTLWYVALREKNLLATQKEETRRMGVSNVELQVPQEKVRACRKTMARIKVVLNERRLLYEGAAKIAENQLLAAINAQAKTKVPNEQDKIVHEYQRTAAHEKRISRPSPPSKSDSLMIEHPGHSEEEVHSV